MFIDPAFKLSLKFGGLASFSNDIELVRSLHEGNGKAYAAIYERFSMQLNYFVQSITGDQQAAEDIASESFLKVFRRKNEFVSIADLKSFLFKVASNGALDYVKVQKRYRNHLGAWMEVQRHWAEDVHQTYIQAETVAAVYRELEKLPPQVRQVIRLSLFENLTIDEVAKEMNIASKTVKNHKTKGLALLREAVSANKDLHPLVVALALNLVQAHA